MNRDTVRTLLKPTANNSTDLPVLVSAPIGEPACAASGAHLSWLPAEPKPTGVSYSTGIGLLIVMMPRVNWKFSLWRTLTR